MDRSSIGASGKLPVSRTPLMPPSSPLFPAAALVLATTLAGCISTPGPDAKLDVPARFSNGAPGPARPLATDWWKEFRSAELTRYVQETEAGNLDIAAAQARIVQADANARVAGAPLLPSIDLNGSGARSRAADLSRLPGANGNRVQNLFSTGLSASYEIDFWGKNRLTYQAAQDAAQASRFDRDTIALSSVASTATTYFQVLGAYERRAIARKNIESASRILGIIQERLAVGTATSLDLAQQESVVANLKAQIPPLDQEIGQDEANLAILLGRAPERVTVKGRGFAGTAIPPVRPGLPSELLLRRPDIAFAEAQLAAAHADVGAARAAFFPSITLSAQGGIESLALRTLFDPAAGFASMGANLVQPIFQGFRLEGQLEQAQGREAELLQAYRKSVISAFADVEKALIATRQLALQEKLQRDALESARRAYEISEQRLREGTVDIVTVLTTQQTLFEDEDAVARTRLQRLLAAVQLHQALGGGWTAPPQGQDKAKP
jgi:NodT family efflux transporter outer membrane factor (OMF) lipoprotein